MSVLLFLILASLALAVAALLGFVWAVKSGQFEDTCTPSMRVLMEETERPLKLESGHRETAEAVKKDDPTTRTQLKSGVNETPAFPSITTQFAALSRNAAPRPNRNL